MSIFLSLFPGTTFFCFAIVWLDQEVAHFSSSSSSSSLLFLATRLSFDSSSSLHFLMLFIFSALFFLSLQPSSPPPPTSVHSFNCLCRLHWTDQTHTHTLTTREAEQNTTHQPPQGEEEDDAGTEGTTKKWENNFTATTTDFLTGMHGDKRTNRMREVEEREKDLLIPFHAFGFLILCFLLLPHLVVSLPYIYLCCPSRKRHSCHSWLTDSIVVTATSVVAVFWSSFVGLLLLLKLCVALELDSQQNHNRQKTQHRTTSSREDQKNNKKMAQRLLGVFPENPDLRAERNRASFPLNCLTFFLEGDESKTKKRKELGE